jgi:hypothetical protein
MGELQYNNAASLEQERRVPRQAVQSASAVGHRADRFLDCFRDVLRIRAHEGA